MRLDIYPGHTNSHARVDLRTDTTQDQIARMDVVALAVFRTRKVRSRGGDNAYADTSSDCEVVSFDDPETVLLAGSGGGSTTALSLFRIRVDTSRPGVGKNLRSERPSSGGRRQAYREETYRYHTLEILHLEGCERKNRVQFRTSVDDGSVIMTLLTSTAVEV